MFGNGVYQVNALKAIAHVEHLLVRNSVLLFDDFTWSVTANGILMNLESVKGLLTQEDSSETRELLGRVGESPRVRHDAIKMGSCNCASFEAWYGEKVEPQHLGAIMRRIKFLNLHELELPSGEVVDLCPVITDDEKEHYKASGYRVVEVDGSLQRWPMYQIDIGVDHPNMHKSWAFPTNDTQSPTNDTQPLTNDTQPPSSPMTTRPPPTPAHLDVDLGEAVDADEDWLAQGLGELISNGLVYVESTGPNKFTTTAVVERLSSHEMFMSVVAKIAIAFGGQWDYETRDSLVSGIEHKIPDLDTGYLLKHMIRSLSYVFGLAEIPCRDKYFEMSRHNSDAIRMLENAGWKPSDIIDYMRNDSDGLGVVNECTLVDDDMVLELVICQTKSIWDAINFGQSSVYDLVDLADYDACKGIYYGIWRSTIGDGEINNGEVGITHSSLAAYNKLNVFLTPVSRTRPLEFDGEFPQTKAKATYFVALMKALVQSGVIAKTPLKNASDSRALYGAKVDLEAKGFHGPDLAGLLVATHRLWTPGRMKDFVSNISAAGAASN